MARRRAFPLGQVLVADGVVALVVRTIDVLLVIFLAVMLAVSATSAAGATSTAALLVPHRAVITIDGRGWGHGHGLSQYGAEGAARQGRSGLGLEAQRNAVLDYLNGGHWDLKAEFTEQKLFPVLDQLEAAIAPDAALDRQRWPGQNDDLHAGIDQVKKFIKDRRAYLNREIPRMRASF